MSLIVADVAAESGHWYTKGGEPAYEIVGANGKRRPTTLRDARKLGLVPSVTTIIRQAASPGLDRWKQEQVLLAALTLPRIEGESEQDYLRRILDDSKQQGKDAADVGTYIHASVEKYYAGEAYPAAHEPYVQAVVKEVGLELQAERSFAHPLGFGGKLDLSSKYIVVDVKTKDFDDPTKVKSYDEHLMQVAAYRRGMSWSGLVAPDARCCNVFLSRTVPGLVKTIWWTPDDLLRGWEMFEALLRYWQVKNGVMP
jgi:hypothetical protein